MANPWTVAPEVVQADLVWTDPDGIARNLWVKIKKFLTVGEERVVQTAGWKGVTGMAQGEGGGGDAEIRIDWKQTSFARAQAYLVDWSLEDDRHNRMPLTSASLQALHPEVFELIEKAISDHVQAMDTEKKARVQRLALVPTSA